MNTEGTTAPELKDIQLQVRLLGEHIEYQEKTIEYLMECTKPVRGVPAEVFYVHEANDSKPVVTATMSTHSPLADDLRRLLLSLEANTAKLHTITRELEI